MGDRLEGGLFFLVLVERGELRQPRPQEAAQLGGECVRRRLGKRA